MTDMENVLGRQWRQGRRVGRCIHMMVGNDPQEADVLIGVFDHPEISAHIVSLHNRWEPRPIDGPEYHTDHGAWESRHLDPWGRRPGNSDYGREPPENSPRWLHYRRSPPKGSLPSDEDPFDGDPHG